MNANIFINIERLFFIHTLFGYITFEIYVMMKSFQMLIVLNNSGIERKNLEIRKQIQVIVPQFVFISYPIQSNKFALNNV